LGAHPNSLFWRTSKFSILAHIQILPLGESGGTPGEGNSLRRVFHSQGHRISTPKSVPAGRYIPLSGAGVKLKRKDGKAVTLPLDRLSKADQTAARKLAIGLC
jgi:hypothetical protein